MKTHHSPIKIAIADDHQLFREGLIDILKKLNSGFQVSVEATHGKMLVDQIFEGERPDIILMDANMPIMDGMEATAQIKSIWPQAKILALTMLNDENSLLKLLRSGVDGYLNKDAPPEELEKAIVTMSKTGSYYSDSLALQLVSLLRKEESSNSLPDLNEQESTFLKWACTEHTYQMIADEMCLSIKTIDGYRARLFEKLNVKSRVGLVIYALKHQLVELDQIKFP